MILLTKENAPLPCDNPLENDETPLFSPRKSLHLCPIHPTEEKGGYILVREMRQPEDIFGSALCRCLTSNDVCNKAASLKALRYLLLSVYRYTMVGIIGQKAANAGPIALFRLSIAISRICPTTIPLTHMSNMKGNLWPPISNLGLYKKIIVHRRSGVQKRK
jgi:hypothetical protein